MYKYLFITIHAAFNDLIFTIKQALPTKSNLKVYTCVCVCCSCLSPSRQREVIHLLDWQYYHDECINHTENEKLLTYRITTPKTGPKTYPLVLKYKRCVVAGPV